jgi:predicted lipoprotein with Yx(FWY)xxD motif
MTTGGGSEMLDRELQKSPARSRRRTRPSRLVVCAAVVTVALVGSFAAMALAAGSATPVLGATANTKFAEQIVVDAHGRTLYALSPETSRRLLCKSSECLSAWPPLTVRSRKAKLTAGPGVHGRLGILKRSNGMLQVTLRGVPVYRFSGDSAKGAANGEGIKSFGGTWHALSAASSTPPAPASTETTPPSSPPPMSPGYPSQPTTSTPAATPTPTTPTTPTTTTTTTPTTTPSEPPYSYPPGY